MLEESKKQEIVSFLVIIVLLAAALFSFTRINSLTGSATLENAEIMPGKESYAMGDLATLFVFPNSADYDIEVYDPEGNLYANALNFPVEKAGTYIVKATLRQGSETKQISTEFKVIEEKDEEDVEQGIGSGNIGKENKEEITEEVKDKEDAPEGYIADEDNEIGGEEGQDMTQNPDNVSLLNAAPAADESTPINISAEEAENTSNAAGVVSSLDGKPEEMQEEAQEVKEVGDLVKDEENKPVGKKVEDDESFETFFTLVGKEGENFRLSFYHNSIRQQPVWIEGDVDAQITNAVARPNETINVTVPLVNGKIPKFKLHVGRDSDIFEFGITIINVQSYPTVGGNWTVMFTTEGIADLTITPINGTLFGTDLDFLELRCGNNVLDADYDGNSVHYSTYGCAEQGSEVSKVITGGPHHLMFEFGDAKVFANNFAEADEKTVCLSGCTYDNLTACLSAINNTDNGCTLTQPNYVYDLNASDYKFYLPITVTGGTGGKAIRINATNITLNCNESVIRGSHVLNTAGIYVEPYNNITIKNCIIENFYSGVYLINSSYNNLSNINISNSTYNLYLYSSSKSTYRDIELWNASSTSLYLNFASTNNTFIHIKISNTTLGAGRGIDVGDSHSLWNYFENINATNLYSAYVFTANFTTLRDSFASDCVAPVNINYWASLHNNTIRDMVNPNGENSGVYALGTNNITNNTFINVDIGILIEDGANMVENNTIQNCTSINGCIMVLAGSKNNTIKGNIINNSAGDAIDIEGLDSWYGDSHPQDNNVTMNTISNTAEGNFDLFINASNTSVSFNSFYGRGVSDIGNRSEFCINGLGNFYNSTVNYTHIGWNDCGPVNVTYPHGGETFNKWSVSTIKVNWSNQSSPNPITYNAYYSSDSGGTWTDLTSTTALSYSWDITGIDAGSYLIKVIPYDGAYNGTNNQSVSTFSIRGNNNFVCSDPAACEYQNITAALFGENNTVNNITLVDSNAVYTINGSHVFKMTVGSAVPAITMNGSNVTLDCNGTKLLGDASGYGVYASGLNNVTILNCNISNFDRGIFIDSTNITVINSTYVDSSATYNFYIQYSNNTNITNSWATNAAANDGIYFTYSHFNYVNNVNSSNNYAHNYYADQYSTTSWIYNSYFFRSITEYNVNPRSNNTYVENCTIMNGTANDKGGLVFDCTTLTSTFCSNITARNNTILNNGFNLIVARSNNALIYNNYFGQHTDTELSGTGLNANVLVVDCLDCNATFQNNIFESTNGHQIEIGDIVTGSYTKTTFVNITNNTFSSTGSAYFDIAMQNDGNTNNSIWLNNFYSGRGVNDSFGYNNSYCVGGKGNFYISGTNSSFIGIGDCGPVNITFPNRTSVFITETAMRINWTNQSSMHNISYHLYYSLNSGSAWVYSGSTNETNYTLDISSFSNTPTFGVRVTPFDGTYNSTFGNISGFRIGPDNQWVCSEKTLCEYNNITGALDSENNTANNLTLLDANTIYTIYKVRVYNISVDAGDEAAIIINASNTTLTCNSSEIFGGSVGYGIYSSGFDNVTINNCRVRNYSIGINLTNSLNVNLSNVQSRLSGIYGFYIFNITNGSFSLINSSDNTYDNLILVNSSNNTIKNSRFINSTSGAGIILNYSSHNTLLTINSSINYNSLLQLNNDSDFNIIKTSNFENSTSGNGIAVYSSNNTIFKNAIIDVLSGSAGGIILYGPSLSGIGAYNNISNNTIKHTNVPLAIVSYGNIVQNNIINGSNTTLYGALTVAGNLVENNTIKNNVINNSKGDGIYIGFYNDGYAKSNNLTKNLVDRSSLVPTYHDLYINTSSDETNVWNNSFYKVGVKDYGTSNSFCLGTYGNFYGWNITYENRASNDCGPANITVPDGGGSYKGVIQINWTKQSSYKNLSYYVLYSNDSGTNWVYINSTAYTNYSWDTSWLENYSMSTFMVKIIPYDGYYNGTMDNSTTVFNISVNNNWVCANSSYCEYDDISSAFVEQNNIAGMITLMDENTIYTFNNSLSYNLSPQGSGPAVNITKPNVTLDCGNALLSGSGSGHAIFSLGKENLTIINCKIYNYSYGITFISSIFDRIVSSIINGSRITGLNMTNVSNSTIEYTNVFGSVNTNLMLENAINNTIKYVNLTNASQYGIFLKSSDNNRFYSINSSANNLENMYIDVKSDNNTVENSTFANSSTNNIFISGGKNNISSSIFSNISAGNFDLVINGSASYTSVWLNNFYSGGVNDTGSNSIFCMNNSGNYYNPLISSTYRVTGSCSNLSEPYADKDGDGYYTIYDCNDGNSLIYPGATEYCDDFDNDCDGLSDEGGVCVVSKSKSAGTSGGSGGAAGSGGGVAITSYKEVNIQHEQEFSIAKYEEVKFTVKGTGYSLKLNKIYEASVSVSISPGGTTFEINVDEEKQMDMDKDGSIDLILKLVSITGPKAYFYIQEIQPKAEEKPKEPEQPQKTEEQKAEEAKAEQPQEEKPSRLSFLGRIWGGMSGISKKPIIIGASVLAVMAVLASGFIYYRDVVERIKPLEDFIESAVEKGYSREKVRKELIETGWEEEVIDSVLDLHKWAEGESKSIGSSQSTYQATKKEKFNESKDDKAKIREYVDKALKSGFTKEQVKEMLVKKGWKDDDIAELLR